MQFSFRLILVGVGVLIASGNAAAGMAQPPNQSVSSGKANPVAADPANQAEKVFQPERWLQSVPGAGSWLRSRLPLSSFVQSVEVAQALPATNLPQDGQAVQRPASASNSPIAPKSAAPIKQAPAKQTPIQTPTKQAQTTTPSPTQPTQTPPPPSALPTSNPVVEPVYKPLGPAKTGGAPDYLNPDPNPLAFPTKAEEVKLRGIQPISLQQALELAERNSLTYQAARLQFQRSQSALVQSQAELYPTFDVSANVSRSESASTKLSNRAAAESGSFLDSLSVRDPLSRGFTGSATLSYDVFTSGGRPARIRAAGQQLRSDQLQVEVTREQLRLDVTNAYYDVQQADANVGIGRAAVRNSQISLRDAQALEQAGIGTRFDVLRARVQLANSQQQLTNAIAQQEINRRQLAQTLNISPSINLAAADPVEAAGEWNLSLDDSIVLAFKNRAELEQQLAQREQAQQQKKAALSALGPTLSVSAQYNITDPFTDTLGVAGGYAVQAGINWRLFDGGSARASAAQQQKNIEIAETNFANTRNQIRFQVEQGYSNLLANRENIITARAAVTEATEALRLARLRFQAGVGTQTDVINAETDLTNAQGNLVSAILGYNRSLATLQRSVTNLPIPTGSRTPSPVPGPASPSLNTDPLTQTTTPNSNGTTPPGDGNTTPTSPGTPPGSTSPPPSGSGTSTP